MTATLVTWRCPSCGRRIVDQPTSPGVVVYCTRNPAGTPHLRPQVCIPLDREERE